MPDLSPKSKAIIDAFEYEADMYLSIAAVLREVAEQCIPMKNIWGTSTMVPKLDPEVSRRMILDIAAELEQV